jgi:hypothetical protein
MTPVVRLLEAGLLAWFGALALLVIIVSLIPSRAIARG